MGYAPLVTTVSSGLCSAQPSSGQILSMIPRLSCIKSWLSIGQSSSRPPSVAVLVCIASWKDSAATEKLILPISISIRHHTQDQYSLVPNSQQLRPVRRCEPVFHVPLILPSLWLKIEIVRLGICNRGCNKADSSFTYVLSLSGQACAGFKHNCHVKPPPTSGLRTSLGSLPAPVPGEWQIRSRSGVPNDTIREQV